MTDLHHWSFHPNHRTTLNHFFTKSPWDEERLLDKLQEWILRQIERLAKRKNQPLFVSIDDAICKKRSLRHGLRTPFKGVMGITLTKIIHRVWGHSLVWLMMHTMTQASPFAFRLYDKAAGTSKIDLAIEMLSSLKVKPDLPVCVLMDS
ncbi:UNVERIFIED_ORG: hypothetical protein BDK47_1046 [Anoxybacillus amylolyticus]